MTVKANYLPISGANYKRRSCTATKTTNCGKNALLQALQ